MGLFSSDDMKKINEVAKKSKQVSAPKSNVNARSMTKDLNEMSQTVIDYFPDSPAILITTEEELHNYIDACIAFGYCAIDTETTGLDRVNDKIVGVSLYVPGQPECYIPTRHLVPLFETLYRNQLSYEQIAKELQRLVDHKVKMIFANADFDIVMIDNNLHVDFVDVCYFDVLIASKCLKENEPRGDLKSLYNKYVLKGVGDPKKFSDFFSVKLFPYSNPDVAKLYAANDAKITYELFRWQLPYLTKDNPKCIKKGLQQIADLAWNLEFPLIKVCVNLHRTGMYLDNTTAKSLHDKYTKQIDSAKEKLAEMVQIELNKAIIPIGKKVPFTSGQDFNCESPVQVKYLLYDVMKLPKVGDNEGTGKEVLHDINLPITNQILHVRSLGVLINTFIDKLPGVTGDDSRIHAQLRQWGADTGRMSCIAGGTKILLINGQKNIENVKVGDAVYCYDDKMHIHISKVLNVISRGSKECIKIKWSCKDDPHRGHLICTPDHKILQKWGKWSEAQELKKGNLLAHFEIRAPHDHIIDSIEPCGECEVYDLEIEDYHNFIANEICVHNCADPNLQNIPSHASDIRHMFRGTPSKYETLSCNYLGGTTIQIELSKYDNVQVITDKEVSWKSVHNLVLDDKVRVRILTSKLEGHVENIQQSKVPYKLKVNLHVSAASYDYVIDIKTAAYAMLSCDYSRQEPAIVSMISQDPNLIQAFKDGKDVYSIIASIAFNLPYESCLEFNPVTHEYQKEGKARRGEAKTIVLGICYGRSVASIGDQLYGTDPSLDDDSKTKKAQAVYDSVLNAFPNLRKLMHSAQHQAETVGYVKTILGRRRHLPDMMLKPFEFKALSGYVNPDIDPLDPSTFTEDSGVPKRIVEQLESEFSQYKAWGKIVKRTKELRDDNIQVINNRPKIRDASRQCVNSAVQGSAADMTKMAILALQNNPEWNSIGGRLLVPIHDELLCEVPQEEWEHGGQVLSDIMVKTANFMPFKMTCDVDTTLRWSGLEYPCPYKKPDCVDCDDEDSVSWMQYHLYEMEYDLPVYKNASGDSPIGNASKGVNGRVSDSYFAAIQDYEKRYNITDSEFLDHIEMNVQQGLVNQT